MLDTSSPFPPEFSSLIQKLRHRANRIAYMLFGLGCFAFLMLFIAAVVMTEMRPKAWVALPMGIILCYSGWRLSRPNARDRVNRIIEDELRSLGNKDVILAEIERELETPVIDGSDGTLTEHWVISSNFRFGFVLWRMGKIEIVDFIKKGSHNFAEMNVLFKSGQFVTLADSPSTAREVYATLTQRFGPIKLTPVASKVIDVHGEFQHLVDEN